MINIYCDESCHLEHDKAKAMLLGAISCSESEKSRIYSEIRAIKERHSLSTWNEIKWTSVSPSKLCNQNCNASHHAIVVKYGAETRNVCLLRASRLPWIIDIIKLAGKNDSSVNVWLKPGTGRQNGKLYLRYNHHGADFVLIFSVEKRFYRLISAFPVFYTNEKENFDKDYRKYAWSYFDT